MAPALLLALLLLASILLVLARCARSPCAVSRSPIARLVRRWWPRTPADCPQCRQAAAPLPTPDAIVERAPLAGGTIATWRTAPYPDRRLRLPPTGVPVLRRH